MRLGSYELIREIGRGAVGVVYEARGPAGERAAVKLLKLQGPRAGDRFERERRLLAALGEEQGFVPLLDAGEDAAGPWIAMPFVEGGTLRARLQAGALPLGAAIALVKTLAEAAGRAHAAGIVHRDLKPENVLFTRDGRPLIADLGLAKHFARDVEGTVSLTRDGILKGTAGYMAPEQMRDAKTAGPPADVFALGAILYECVSGREPFVGTTIFELIRKAEEGDFEPLAGPEWLRDVVERALDPEAGARFAHGADLAAALVAPATPRTETTRRAFLAASALGLAGAGGLALRALARNGDAPRVPATPSVPAGPVSSASPTRRPPPRGIAATRRTKLVETIGTTAWKMPDALTSVAFLPGDRAVAASHDGTVLLIDLETGRELRRFAGHQGTVSAVAARSDGSLIALAGRDRTVWLWRLEDEAPLAKLVGNAEAVNALAFSEDGARLVSGGHDHTVRVFDVAGARMLRVLQGHGTPVLAVAVHGEKVVSGGEDGKVRVFASLDAPGRVVHAHGESVRGVAFSPDGERIASAGTDNFVRVTTGAKTVALAAHRHWVYQVAFPDRDHVLSSSRDRSVALWHVDEEREVWRREAHKGGVTALALDGSRARALSGGTDHLLVSWDLAKAEPLPARVEGHQGGVLGVVDAGRGGIFSVGFDYTLRRGASILSTTKDGWVRAVALSADGSRLATVNEGGSGELWDVRAEPLRLGSFSAHESGASAVGFLDEEGKTPSRFFSAGRDGALEVWDARTLKVLRSVQLRSPQLAASASFDAKRIATGTPGRQVHVWDAETLAAIAVLKGHRAAVTAVAFLPDGERLLSGSEDGELRLWDIARAATIDVLDGHAAGILALAVARDGSLVATGSLDGKLRLWRPGEVRPADEVEMTASADVASALAWARDKKSLIAGTGRGVVLRFEVRSG